MQETASSLIALGLTPTEAAVYLAGLSYESVTVQDLVRSTKVKRPTIYHALSRLQERGLAAEKRVGERLRFYMSPPQNLHVLVEAQKQRVGAQEKLLQELLPSLSARQKRVKQDGVGVVHYSGIEGMKMVMDMAFYCKTKRWDVIAPFNNFLREYDSEYAKQYLQSRKYHGISARTLWENTKDGKPLSEEERSERNPRLMPWVMHGKFKSMMVLFDDKVAVFSPYDKLSAVLITSTELHALFASMFEGLWEFSERY